MATPSSLDALIRRLGGNMPTRGRVSAEIDPEVARYLERMGRDARSMLPMDIQGRPHVGGSVDGWPAGTEGWAAPRTLDTLDVPAPPASTPDMGIETELFGDMYKSAGAYDNLRKGRTRNLRNSGGDLARIAGENIRRADDAAKAARERAGMDDVLTAAGGGLALGLGANTAMRMAEPGSSPIAKKPADPPEMPVSLSENAITEPSQDADLAAESRPAPEVPATEDIPEPTPPRRDYAYEARALINQLNEMRRQAGGEVPQAGAMMAEINRLLAMSDAEKNSPDYQETLPPDYHGQARLLIQQLNEMRRQAGGEVPQARQIMTEVSRLRALGDAQRNARTT